MNERIRELAEQSGKTYAESFRWEYLQDIDKDILGKFAELIVGECLTIVERKEYSYHEADPLWETAQLIREHFGVEE
jgi:hypothetical protein